MRMIPRPRRWRPARRQLHLPPWPVAIDPARAGRRLARTPSRSGCAPHPERALWQSGLAVLMLASAAWLLGQGWPAPAAAGAAAAGLTVAVQPWALPGLSAMTATLLGLGALGLALPALLVAAAGMAARRGRQDAVGLARAQCARRAWLVASATAALGFMACWAAMGWIGSGV